MTASIFVKDASEFQTIQKDLESLKAGLGQDSPELDALWERANRIAKINDKCSMISINDVLDEECSHFYAVELPEFETKYMEVTGELRLGAMKMGSTLAERTEQIKACAVALGGILVSKEQLLKLNGSVDLEPLSFEGAFDATYNFNLYFGKFVESCTSESYDHPVADVPETNGEINVVEFKWSDFKHVAGSNEGTSFGENCVKKILDRLSRRKYSVFV